MIWMMILCLLSMSTHAQEPVLANITGHNEKVNAWLAYCAALRLNQMGAKDNYINLEKAGLKGLQMLQPAEDSARAAFYMYVALGNYYQLKFDSAQIFFYNCMRSAQSVKATKLIAASNEALMSLNFQMQQQAKVEENKNILQNIVDTTKDSAILQDIYAAFGSYYEQKSYYSTAQDYYLKSIELREKLVDITQNSKAKFDYAIQCDQLSKLYLNTQMPDKSIAALRKAGRFADVSPVVSNRLLSSFVEAFTTAGNIDSALVYYHRLVENTKGQTIFPSELVSSNLNIGIYYLDHHQYNQAHSFVQKGDSLAAVIQSPFLTFQAQMIKGRLLEETGQSQQAIDILQQALPISAQLSKELQSNILKYMALAYKGMGNTAKALQYYEQYTGVQDSLNTQKISRTFADLETHYQTTQKENQIVALNQKNRLNELELKQASNTRRMLTLGLLSLGVVSLLLYFIYRNKEKLNKIMNHRNAELDTLNNELSVANETKARLFGVISHDLRAPVSSIVQLLQLQKEIPGNNEMLKQQYQTRINTASENLLDAMEDLLLWSKSQMNSFTPQYRPVKILPLLQQELQLLHEQVKAKELRVSLNVSKELVFNTDENFMAVIFRNLLQNAINVSRHDDDIKIEATSKAITLTNKAGDTTANELNAAFMQSQVGSKHSGLGLQIVRGLVEKLGIKLNYLPGDNNTIVTEITMC